MHAIGPVIRLDNDNDLRPINLFNDWYVDELARLVHHRPSKLTFVIEYIPPSEGDWVKRSGLSAQLVHACGDTDVPPAATLRQIAKDAIHAFLFMADVCHEPTSLDEIPF